MTATQLSSSLNAFVQRVSATRRLNFADLRRLQRDVLPEGAQSRADVEALIRLDTMLNRSEAGWPSYLVDTVQGFVEGDPVGDAAWLVPALQGAHPKTALALARAVISVLDEPCEDLRALAKVVTRRRSKAAACRTGLSSSRVSAPAVEVVPAAPVFSFIWPNVRIGGQALIVSLAPEQPDNEAP